MDTDATWEPGTPAGNVVPFLSRALINSVIDQWAIPPQTAKEYYGAILCLHNQALLRPVQRVIANRLILERDSTAQAMLHDLFGYSEFLSGDSITARYHFSRAAIHSCSDLNVPRFTSVLLHLSELNLSTGRSEQALREVCRAKKLCDHYGARMLTRLVVHRLEVTLAAQCNEPRAAVAG